MKNYVFGWQKNNLFVSISIGVKNEDKKLLFELKSLDLVPDFITVDIAHGHSVVMENILKFIKLIFKDTKVKPFIIAGNIMSEQAVKDLESWGADALKIGVVLVKYVLQN